MGAKGNGKSSKGWSKGKQSGGKGGKGQGFGKAAQKAGGKSGTQTKGKNNGGGADSDHDRKRFIQKLAHTRVDLLGREISADAKLWADCWDGANGLDAKALQELILVVGTLPPSANPPAPPAHACMRAVQRYLRSEKGAPEQAVKAVEVCENVVKRLLDLEWDVSKDEVRESLQSILEEADGCLQIRHKDHKEAKKRIMDLLDDIEKPWRIKLKQPDATPSQEFEFDAPTSATNSWQHATVSWLCKADLFAPPLLPKMRGGKGKGVDARGIYDSPDQYMETIQQLMVAMTFSDGNAAISPKCWHRDQQSGKDCGAPLWPIPESVGLQCRRRGCSGSVVLACANRNHNSGLCKKCANQATMDLLGRAGKGASTHIYDALLSHIGADGKLYFKGVASRSPPQMPIHWRTTKRLQSPNLVAVVKLSEQGAALKMNDRIYWGEISHHPHQGGKPSDESRKRENGCLAVNMASVVEFDADIFAEGEYLAVIDCMTFVPEYIPVLKALEKQSESTLPFENGAYLNLCSWHQPDLSNVLADDEDMSRLQPLVESLIDESKLQPIVEIRRHEHLADACGGDILKLLKGATLDEGQLRSFIDGLRNPMHLTQGPPGTGKSYLGVVMVRALLIIRKYWVQVNPTVGTPPILVLSYKNHAIDEFLVDLVKAEPKLGNKPDMIRIGGGSSLDQRLSHFSERNLGRKDQQVWKLRENVEWLHDLSSALKAVCQRSSSFTGYQADMFQVATKESEDAAQKKRSRCAYEATEMLLDTVVRHRILLQQLGGDEEDEEMFEFVQDDMELFNQLDFIREDFSWKSSDKTQQKLKPWEVSQEIRKLQEGIQHYVHLGYNQYSDPGEVLLMFLRGDRPLPLCCKCDDQYNLAYDHTAPLCGNHRCFFELEDWSRCPEPVLDGRKGCRHHACAENGCMGKKMPREDFCRFHACFMCLKLGHRALKATDEPPRNTCEKHVLCYQCDQLALDGKDVCKDHNYTQCMVDGCGLPAVWYWLPYCKNHLPQRRWGQSLWTGWSSELAEPVKEDSDGEEIEEVGTCMGKNRKGKPCGAKAERGSKYCRVHAPPKESLAQMRDQTVKAEPATNEVKQSFYDAEAPQAPEAPEAPGTGPSDNFEDVEFASAGSEQERPTIDEADGGKYDNQDEVEEADHLQHLREVYDCDDWINESSSEEVEGDEATFEGENPQDAAPAQLPNEWTWDMPFKERWEACQMLMSRQRDLLTQVIAKIKDQSWRQRKALREAEVRASARVYEDKSIIGGTIVGCISRLEAIRSTRPFAVVVEEASEVLEPLLFSCFVSSTVKLEMIGDHLQLQPSIMQKFAFERINNVNISMFERLIRAPDDHKVPSSVLAVQRRMRKDVCDLTREYYSDITSIEDHETCWTKTIPGKVASGSFYKGREVPGVASHIFLWTHSGSQGKAEVGLSKINRQEADMAIWLAYYLVQCGVPKPSIVILTPYKGQLMLIRKQLLSDQSSTWLLSRDPSDVDQIRLSTVDRFQGDEGDVVIASLVVDEHSKTPFVKLQNRMIVLLSRARLGMYILGNTGYFENGKPEKHWQRTFEILQEPVASPDSKGDTKVPFAEARVGRSLPLCCGQHPTSTCSAGKPKDLALGFCKMKCDKQLSCTHPCGLQCHWPQKKHNKQCEALVDSPCARHAAGIPCKEVFANSQATSDDTIQEALASYRCPVKVKLLLPCSHEPEMLCADEEDIQRGKRPMPKCHETSHTPYVYPVCKHTRDVTCFQLSEYQSSPNKVPLCEHMVEYLPVCGHSISVKCSLKSAYLQAASQFVCPKKLEIDLPRCGHRAKVSCLEERNLRGWDGGRCSEKDIVREGQQYGPLDHDCNKEVTFVRRCNHKEKVRCGKAFELANVKSHCNEQVPIVHPHCGHECQTPCHQSQQYADLPRPEKCLDSFDEAELSALPPPLPGLTCNMQVLVKRRCGHEVKIPCKVKTSSLPPCKEMCIVASPLCGHDIEVPCHSVDAMQRWKPWDAEVMEHLRRGELRDPKPQEISTPQELLEHAKTCKKTLRVIRPCGHAAEYNCKELSKILKEGQIKGLCYEKVEKPLACGHIAMAKCHEHQKYQEGKGGISCKEKTQRECWNSSTCGSRRLVVPCSSTTKFCCDKTSSWHCPNQRHSYEVKVCSGGSPTECPGCQDDRLSAEMQDIQTALEQDSALNSSLHGCFLETKSVLGFSRTACFAEEMHDLNPSAAEFRLAQLELLQAFKEKQENTPPWSRQIFEPKLIPVFFILPKKQSFQGFSVRKQIKAETLEGIQVFRLSEKNLRGLHVKEDMQLVYGKVYTLSSCKENWPGNKQKVKKGFVMDMRKQGRDSFEAKDAQAPQRFVVWHPYAMVMTHGLRLSKQSLSKAASSLESHSMQDLASKHITLQKPDFKVTIASAAPEPQETESELYMQLEELQETFAADLVFPREWNGALTTGSTELTDKHDAELKQKLSFMNTAATPFAGKNLLDQLSTSCKSELLDLLYALELVGTDADRSKEYLEKYVKSVKASPRREAHPLLLLAMWRQAPSKGPVLLALQRFPGLEEMLSESEKAKLETGPSVSSAIEPAELWEEMKETKGCSSEAMDKLMALTGLKKVKATAVALYKSALQFQKMSPETRKANSMALNYCFLGNPGTGKTTVARLFAAILHDSELRSRNVFQESGAQKVKDDGIDEFRKLAQSAMDGVLFIDEAYDLDPVGDKFKGAPIVNELVTLTENERARLTCILAGYEDDMNNKFFAYNPGLKSRFIEVIFEDFDEKELSQIWLQNMEEKGWKGEDPRLTNVAINRILKSRGKKGFGNAREVRKKIETATQSAMSRDDFNPTEMLLRFADVVGEDPRSNAKLKDVRDRIDRKIGWKKIKEAVKELVTVCGTNYQRELDGQAPLPVFLNRLFLGNPGTGKTTCAKLYGEVLKHLGFLSSGDVVCKTASDLGGSVVGEAKQKVLSVLQSAAGKVLVVDEAYSLDDNLYGKQVLDVLVEKIQGTENDDIAFLLLGYEEPISAMLRNQNPGLARRFPLEMAFRFEDYTDQELMEILRQNCREKDLRVSLEFQEKALRKLDMLRRSSSNFGNAGAVENLLKSAMLKASARGGNDVSLLPDDIELGPEADSQEDPFAPLDKLYRMEKVKSKLQQMSNAFAVAQQEGSEIPELGHFIFTGAPGTGKTTVARVMSRILFQLRLLGRDHVEETSGLNLTGEYVGQTKKKVEEQLDAAKGGVLFIDEAYELGKGPFGAEACTAIVAAMTDPKYRGVVIIMAGYPGDMHKMLDTNPGLKSRFTHFINFEDWSPEDCLHLFRKRAKMENLTVQEAVEVELKEGFSALLQLDGWGNARDVDKVWKASKEQRSDRVVNDPEGLEKTLQITDVQPAVAKILEARQAKAPPSMSSFPWENLPTQMPDPKTQETLAQHVKKGQAEMASEMPGDMGAQPDERDPGVSDEIWAELQRAKEATAQEEARIALEQQLIEERLREEAARREEELRREMEEYLRRLAEEEEQARLEEERRSLQAELEARLERERRERERRRLEELERVRLEQARQQAIREKLKQISPCPAGFNWYKTQGGWRCGGGSHFVSDEQLQKQFAH